MSCGPTIGVCTPGPQGPQGPTGPTGPSGSGTGGVSILGNVAGAPALISSGTMYLAGGNNITLSQNGQSITISGGSTTGGIAASFGGNTAGALALVSSGTLVLAGGNNVTLSQNGNSVTISANTAAAANLSVSAGSTSGAFGGLTFANGSNVSFGLNNGTITASVVPQSTQTQPAGNIAGIGTTTTTQAGSTLGATLSTNGLSLAMPPWITTAAGGGLDATLGGNTAGVLALISTGTLFLAGGNNVTLSQNGNSVTISANTAAAANLSVSAGTTTGAFGGLTFSNSNNVSFGLNNGTITASASQSNQTEGRYAIGNTTGQSSSSTFDARTMSISGAGGVSVGYSGNALVISGGAGSSQTEAIFIAGNTTGQSSQSTYTVGSLNISATGVVSVGWSSNSLIVSAPGTTGLTQLSAGMSTGGNTVGTTGLASAQLVLAGGNNITLSGSTNAGSMTITISGGAGGAGPAIAAGTQTGTSGTVVFSNSNGVTFGMSNSSVVTASYSQNTTAAYFFQGNTTGQSSSSTGGDQTISISAAGALSAGWSGGSLVFSSPTQTNQTIGLYAVGNTTQNSSTTLDARTVSFDGLGAMTVGFSNGSVQLSAPATSSISGTGALSVSVNGSTISLGVPGYTASYINPTEQWQITQGQIGQGSLFIQPMSVPIPVQFDRGVVGLFYTQAGASTLTVTLSASVGLYSKNASTLSLIGSTSSSLSINGSGATASSSYIGMRGWSIGSTSTLQPGQYFIAFGSSTSTAGANASISNNVVSQQTSNAYSGIMGQNSNASNQITLGLGIFSTTTNALPSSIAFSAINGSATQGLRPPSIYFTSGTV